MLCIAGKLCSTNINCQKRNNQYLSTKTKICINDWTVWLHYLRCKQVWELMLLNAKDKNCFHLDIILCCRIVSQLGLGTSLFCFFFNVIKIVSESIISFWCKVYFPCWTKTVIKVNKCIFTFIYINWKHCSIFLFCFVFWSFKRLPQ